MTLLAYCQTSIRLGVSQAEALRVYRAQGNGVMRSRFRLNWQTARQMEVLFTEFSGIRRGGDAQRYQQPHP